MRARKRQPRKSALTSASLRNNVTDARTRIPEDRALLAATGCASLAGERDDAAEAGLGGRRHAERRGAAAAAAIRRREAFRASRCRVAKDAVVDDVAAAIL